MMKVVLTGGGTAGHIMPNIALYEYFRRYFGEVIYIGSESGMEKNIAQKYNIRFHSIPVVKLMRGKVLANLKIPFVLTKAVRQAKKLLSDIMPSVIYSRGGYVALPVVSAAKKLDIPVVCHEADINMGLANKLTARYAEAVFTSFENEKPARKKYLYMGTPIREEIFRGDAEKSKNRLGIKKNLPCVLIMGGSMGAKAINECVYKALPSLCKSYNIIHLCGKSGDMTITHPNYFQMNFSDDIADLYALCDVVVSRAGANAAAELDALNKKSVLIPLPKGASRGDQILNARYYEKRGARMLLQESLTPETLLAAIAEQFNMPVKFGSRQSNNERIVKAVYEISKRYGN